MWTFTLTTYYCWNGTIVTYHHTAATVNISSLGSAVGWEYDGDTSDFYCYYANSHKCSGNYESAQGHLRICLIGNYGCGDNVYPLNELWEIYNGNWSWHVS